MFKLDLEIGMLTYFSGFLSSNVYLIVIDGQVVAVDGGMPWTAKKVLTYLKKYDLNLRHIFLTHSHFDHVMGVSNLKRELNVNVLAYYESKHADVRLQDGDIIKILDDNLSLLVIHTGIHRLDHLLFYERHNKLLFAGDHLVTPTTLKMIRKRTSSIPKIILPGHGRPYTLHDSSFPENQ
jgi:hydroxyacylglutathione hydrolase